MFCTCHFLKCTWSINTKDYLSQTLSNTCCSTAMAKSTSSLVIHIGGLIRRTWQKESFTALCWAKWSLKKSAFYGKLLVMNITNGFFPLLYNCSLSRCVVKYISLRYSRMTSNYDCSMYVYPMASCLKNIQFTPFTNFFPFSSLW